MIPSIKPILKYPGAKQRSAAWIVNHFPRTSFYLEPFCGSAAVYFELWARQAGWPRFAVLNDLEGEIVHLFRVLRDPTLRAELLTQIALTPWSREEWHTVTRLGQRPTDPAGRAWAYLLQLWQSYGSGTGGRSTVGWRHQGLGGMRSDSSTWSVWRQLPERLAAAAEALCAAEIECQPARALLRTYAAPDVLIYADPPYLGTTRNGSMYRYELRGVLEHARLLRDLRRHPGPALISGYAHPLYDHMLPGWRRAELVVQAEQGNTRTECLWINPVAQERLGYGPLFEYREEEAPDAA